MYYLPKLVWPDGEIFHIGRPILYVLDKWILFIILLLESSNEKICFEEVNFVFQDTVQRKVTKHLEKNV